MTYKKSALIPLHSYLHAFILLLLCSLSTCPPATAQPPHSDSVITVTAGKHYLKSGFHRFWWGTHYRHVWAQPVHASLFWPSQFQGGLKPVKTGGSFQTKNLRLVDSLGQEYVLRSLDKDPSKALPARLRKTFIANLMRDQTSVIHPYGAFIVPTLAEAANVYHTNPQLVLIADDPALGEYRREFAGMLALLEERPNGDWRHSPGFGYAEKVVSSRKAFTHLLKNSSSQVDAKRYLRSRLFDMWLSDWSRREDQWRWAEKDEGKQKRYEPIPRDRDHAFFLFKDGVLTKLAGLFKPNYQSFDKHLSARDVKGLTKASRRMDAYLLAYLTQEDFRQVALELQQHLADAVIEQALAQWPAEVQKLSRKQFYTRLTSRREDLPKAALAFYRLLNEHVLLPGTDEEDIFRLEFQPNGELLVQYYREGKQEERQLVHQRMFRPKETKSIFFYGLGDEDTFELSGSGKNTFNIQWHGGEDEDELVLPQDWKLTGRKVLILDERDGNEYQEKRGKIRIREHKPEANEFNAKGWLLRHRLYD